LVPVPTTRSANENLITGLAEPAPRIAIGGRDATGAEAGRIVGEAIAASLPGRDGIADTHGDIAPQAVAPPVLPYETPEAAQIRDSALTGAADLGAGMIGGAASYLADQLGEAFAPTPPELREAQSKAAALAEEQREQAKPVNPYLRHAGDAEQKARDDREREDNERYWGDERERRRER